jgi:hypothetical protein
MIDYIVYSTIVGIYVLYITSLIIIHLVKKKRIKRYQKLKEKYKYKIILYIGKKKFAIMYGNEKPNCSNGHISYVDQDTGKNYEFCGTIFVAEL